MTHEVFLCKGTFFEHSQLTYKNIVELIFAWSFKESAVHTVHLTGLSENTVIQWFCYFRDVCSHHLVENPAQIGGIGHYVEIDESLMSKRKNNVGRVVQQRWMFGRVDRVSGRGFLEFVPDRTAATLENVIRRHIAPGSIINSDGFASYNNNVNIPVIPRHQHIVVIHEENFVDPVTGACTNRIEHYSKNAERRLKAVSGTNEAMLSSHLDEFMCREEYGKTPLDAFNNIIDHMQQWYPAP
ncbi:hypothetical protein PoB_001162100 [Plakobranchus ocellatus]|uniref:ISXO2-like transposase domain-containing protein n=1 Tax=Plakobranchus ocellatus TaxID=259542 RepID=A0AAV3YCQ6_9GAST|nr:hypothetical protein PoB_001162100 [Plakobranchus ocellatus]